MTSGDASTEPETRGPRLAGPGAVGRAGLLAAGLVGVPLFFATGLVLVNGVGVLGNDHTLAGLVVACLVAGSAAAAARLAARRWLPRRPRTVTAGLLAYGAALVVLFPTPVDRHESFVPRPNERQECHGWEFHHYPPQTTDGTTTDYCVGVETPLPPG